VGAADVVDPVAAIAAILDAAWYARRYPDVAEADALRHFVAHGLAEGRDPNPFFDGAWYLREYPDAAASGLPALLHYMQRGAASLRDPHPRFDAAWYAGEHPEGRGNPMLHHLRMGASKNWPTEKAPDFCFFSPGDSAGASGRPTLLVVTDDRGDDSAEPDALLLRGISRGMELSAPPGGRTLRLAPERIGDLVRVLKNLGVARMHIQNLPAGRFDLRALVHELGVPFDVALRDYLAICPQRYLLPWPDAQYCGEPGPAGCNACIAAGPSHGATDILTWRRGHDWLFREADRVICPSLDALKRLRRHGLADRATVAASAGGTWPLAVPKFSARARLRVAVFGNAPHQGAPAIAAVSEEAAQGRIEIRVVAARDGAASLAGLRPHVVWFPGQWPDPDCRELDIAIDAGLPIVAARIGAFPERLAGRRLTWLVDPGAPAQGWLDAFAAVRSALPGDSPRPARRAKTAGIGASVGPALRRDGLVDLRRDGRVSVVVVPERFANSTPSPCGYIRLLQPLDWLACSGDIDLVLADPMEALRYRADVIATQRYALPDAASADALARHCRAHGIKLLYDLDDDLLNVPRDHPEAAILRPRARLVARMLGHADAVWVSTEMLRQNLGAAGYPAQVVANGLDQRLWADPPVPVRSSRETTRILYMGTATHDADFAVVAPALARLHAIFANRVRIDLIGVTARGDLPDWINRVALPLQARASYPGFVDWMIRQSWDIGIAPLADTRFNRCKSAIKTLDYAALGLAVLASDVPAYSGSPAELVSNTEAAWFSALARLVRDPRLRLAQARAAQESFIGKLTMAAQSEVRRDALLALARRRVSPSRRGPGPA
jgi:glycosyltransferase involved in cell wall biosynthesis